MSGKPNANRGTGKGVDNTNSIQTAALRVAAQQIELRHAITALDTGQYAECRKVLSRMLEAAHIRPEQERP